MSSNKAHLRHILYRFYDDSDTLLYVGITANPGRRFEKHAYDKPWWSDVSRIDIEHFADRGTLTLAERAAIAAEHPIHNIRMNTSTSHVGELVWNCLICRNPVRDGDGWITAHYRDFERVARRRREWDDEITRKFTPSGGGWRAIPLSAYMDYPSPAQWCVYHKGCDPDVDSDDDYCIEIERIRTYPQLVGWTAHLMGKKWFPDTNWQRILESQAESA